MRVAFDLYTGPQNTQPSTTEPSFIQPSQKSSATNFQSTQQPGNGGSFSKQNASNNNQTNMKHNQKQYMSPQVNNYVQGLPKSQSHYIGPASKQANKYEQMAQNLNLESLIKQAQQRSSTDQAKIATQYAFTNKISGFDGDNDHVEDEESSSNGGSAEKDYEVFEDGDEAEQKQNRLSLTPGSNVVSSGRSESRIFSDLSQKVVNINSGKVTNQNPFTNQVNINKNQNYDYEAVKERPESDDSEPQYISSPIQASEPQQPVVQPKQVSPFEQLTHQYLSKKNEVISKYESAKPQQSEKSPQKLESPEERVTMGSTVNFLQNIEADPTATVSETFALKQKEDVGSRNNQKALLKTGQDDKFLTLDDFLQKQESMKQSPVEPAKTKPSTVDIVRNKSPRPTTQFEMGDIKQREKEQEIKKKREIEQLKIKAKEKEQLRIKRLESTILIQKWVRGHIQRVRFIKMQNNFRYMRKLRRLLSIAYGRLRTKTVKQLIRSLQEVGKQAKSEKDDLFQKYLDHCATTVQKTWRGFYMRTYLIPSIVTEYRTQRALNAVVSGWKIRRILSGCREVLAIKRSLIDIESMLRQTQGRNDPMLPTLMSERRRKIEELCRIIPTLLKKGRWIFSYQKRTKGGKQSSHQKSQSVVKPQYQSSNLLRGMSFNDKFDMVTLKMPTQSQMRTTDPLDCSTYTQQPPQPSVMWPTQQQPAMQQSQYNNYPRQMQQQPTSVKEDASPVVWPSSHKSVSSHDNSNIMWASTFGGQESKPVTKKYSPEKQEFMDTIPLTSRTAVAEKLEILDLQSNKFQNNKFAPIDQHPVNQNFYSNDSFQALHRSRTLMDSNKKESPLKHQQTFQHEDDRPIKPSTAIRRHEDDQNIFMREEYPSAAPIVKSNTKQMPTKKNPVFDSNEFDQYQNSHQEFRESVSPKKYQSQNDSMIAPPQPKYNFEEMIERAMAEQDGGMAEAKRKSLVKRSKTTRNDSENGDDQDDNISDNTGSKTVKQLKKQNLKKRQKYDPKKAIEEAKKQQASDAGQPTAKSSFPEGVITKQKKPDRMRSATEKPKTNEQELEEVQDQQVRKKMKKDTSKPPIRSQPRVDEEEFEEDNEQHQVSTYGSSAAGAKPFLKRKSNKVVIQKKVNWKGASRIDCWTKDKPIEKTTIIGQSTSQTRRKTSNIRSPRVNLGGAKEEKAVEQQPMSQFKNKKQSQNVNTANNASAKNATPKLKAAEVAPKNNLVQQQQQQQMPKQSQITLHQEDQLDVDTIPDENDQVMNAYIDYSSGVSGSLQQDSNYTRYLHKQNSYEQQQPQSHDDMSTANALIHLEAVGGDNQQDNVVLHLDELEKIIELFHPKPQDFADSEIRDNAYTTCLPHMSTHSMFFTCYSDDIYDTILEDLREHYIGLCNE